MKKSKKTPSRMKYEQNHRTVSFRTSKEIDDRLQAVKKAEGLSNADILKSALGLIEMKVTNEKEARKQGYAAGFREGFERATNLYRVTYPCKRCGKIIEIKSAEEKAAARTYMLEKGWGHADCLDGR